MTSTVNGTQMDGVMARRAALADARQMLFDGRHGDAARVLQQLVIELGQPGDESVSRQEQRLMLAYGIVMLAQAYLALGRAREALELATEADQQLTALDDQSDAVHRLRRSCVHALALAHAQVGDHHVAAVHYQRLVRSFRTVVATGAAGSGDEAELALVLEDAAASHMSIGRTDAAIDALTGAVRRWRRMGVNREAPLDHRRRYVRCLALLADFERQRGRLRESEAFRIEALPIAETLPDGLLPPTGAATPGPTPDLAPSATPTDETLPAPRVRVVYGNPPLPERTRPAADLVTH